MTEHELNDLTGQIIGIAIDVHKELGPGLLEKVYQWCLKTALEDAGYSVQMELPLPIIFRGKVIHNEGYRLDLLVNNIIVIEIKSVVALTSVFEKQLSTYLRLADKPCGLLINFNVAYLKHGIKRIKNGFLSPTPSV
ncbi:MAG: GxxExxY protein [Defluviitaleaceae bacterium]|nr:GxxExxY protein [Defluviitaleaceae bacterium]